jgi:hypothetical protein
MEKDEPIKVISKKRFGRKFWVKFVLALFIVPIIFLVTLTTVVYFKQEQIVKELITHVNEDFTGHIEINGSHISPFAAFPYISIDLEDLKVFEGKEKTKKTRILHFADCFIGFNIIDIINGNYTIKSIKISNSDLRLVQHKDGSFNLTKALSTKKPAEKVKSDFKIDLQSIKISNLDVSKLNEANNMYIDAFIDEAKTKVKSSNDHFYLDLYSKFRLSILENGDSTFIKNKHFELDTEIDMSELTKTLTIHQTEVNLENSSFGFSGSVGLSKNVPLNLKFSGEKPNFDLVIAIAPEEVANTLKQFDNQGNVFFEATVKGESANGHSPKIDARFGCKNGFFNNLETNKKLNQIGFLGSFTNGKNHDLKTMELNIQQFSARPEAGKFSGKISVKNFEEPEIDMKLISDFDLDFLAKFINSRELRGLDGQVKLTMNFHDIIDLNQPEKAIEKLNESYFTELLVKDLKFNSPDLSSPINDLDLKASLKGHKAKIEYFNTKMGNSDIHLNGTISDLPAIIHHTDIPVTCDLKINSKKLDLEELTKSKSEPGIDEQVSNLRLDLKLVSSAKKISESEYIPEGEFFIENFYAKFKHYPHAFHDFHADFFVDKKDLIIVDFKGMLDASDFHFNGQLKNYKFWFQDEFNGDTQIDFDIDSKKLRLDNLFSYGGENYVPEDYRHEEIDNMKFHGKNILHFSKGHFKSLDFDLSNFTGKLKVHPLKMENFKGHLFLDNHHIHLSQFTGKMGHSDIYSDLNYNFQDAHVKGKNKLVVRSHRLDVDELTNFTMPPSKSEPQKVDHDKAFSLYDLPFTDMDFSLNVDQLNYHKHKLSQLKAKFHTTKSHELEIQQLDLQTAEGTIKMKGTLSGKDKKHIYFSPNIEASHVDLDKLMLKFENFGQDHLVSENLHGYFNGTITGKIHLHADLVPKLDDSKIKIDMLVTEAKLENFTPLKALETYFEDKNVSKVRFDTLKNEITFDQGKIIIPKMTINSTLGFLELSGTQFLNDKLDMDYEIGVPWKMINNVAANKLFKRSKKSLEEDEIQYKTEKTKFVYVTVKGGLEDFKVSLGRKKK